MPMPGCERRAGRHSWAIPKPFALFVHPVLPIRPRPRPPASLIRAGDRATGIPIRAGDRAHRHPDATPPAPRSRPETAPTHVPAAPRGRVVGFADRMPGFGATLAT